MPKIYDDLIWVWEAFGELNLSRESGFAGPEPLRFSEIRAMADELELTDRSTRTRFFNRIRILDKALLDEANKKIAAKAGKDGGRKNKPKR
jgi:hypothetical protein